MKILKDILIHIWDYLINVYNERNKWFTLNWYKYLFQKKNDEYNWFDVVRCRMKGHSSGVIWYNPHGLEPDMTCKGCGDDLG